MRIAEHRNLRTASFFCLRSPVMVGHLHHSHPQFSCSLNGRIGRYHPYEILPEACRWKQKAYAACRDLEYRVDPICAPWRTRDRPKNEGMIRTPLRKLGHPMTRWLELESMNKPMSLEDSTRQKHVPTAKKRVSVCTVGMMALAQLCVDKGAVTTACAHPKSIFRGSSMYSLT